MSRRYVMGRRLKLDESFADEGTAERWQHSRRALVATERAGIFAMRAEEECALDRWLHAGAISESEHEAGIKLRSDYYHGRVSLMAQRTYDGVRAPTPGANWHSPAERRSAEADASYKRWRSAIRAVGLRTSPLLIAVCCEDGALAWPRRGELRHALQQLERHYKG